MLLMFIVGLMVVLGVNADVVWQLHKINFDVYPNARCLDGSPGGFWFLPGSGTGVKNFVIHHQGGGWCTSNDDCYGRSKSSLGSSSTWAISANCSDGSTAQPCVYDGDSGLRSTFQEQNSLTYNWNKVYIGYCDGASYSGTVFDAVLVPSSSSYIHYKGRFIVDAVYDTLLGEYHMGSASEVIISGTSAGGLAVYLHADYLHTKIITFAAKLQVNAIVPTIAAQSPRVVAIPDAGFFLDEPAINGEYLYTPHYKDVFNFQNVSGSINAACVAHYSKLLDEAGKPQTWKCFMAPYILPFIRTPLFIVNSLVDSWQGVHIMGITCDPTIGSKSRPNPRVRRTNISGTPCGTAEIDYLNNFRRSMLLSSMNEFLQSPGAGAWLSECWTHPLTDYQHYFSDVQVQSRSMRDILFAWYRKDASAMPWIAVDGEWGSNVC